MREFARGPGYAAGFARRASSPDRDVPARTPEETAEANVERVLGDAAAIAKQVDEAIGHCSSASEWQEQKEKLEERFELLDSRFRHKGLQQDAQRTDKAANSYNQAREVLASIKEKLGETRPLRPVPAVAGELALEPSVLARAADIDNLIGWAAGLAARERGALKQRLSTPSDDDGFAKQLHNHLSAARRYFEFQDVLDGKVRKDAYERLIARRRASSDHQPAAISTGGDNHEAVDADAPSGAIGPRPLPDDVRGDLEQATGRSLAHVRLHADREGNEVAEAHDARAVTIDSDVYMAKGQLDTASGAGRELLAHEIAHVAQTDSDQGTAAPATKRDSVPATDVAEADADAFAASFREHGAGAKWSPLALTSKAAAMRAPAAHASASSSARLTIPLYVNKHIVHVCGVISDRIHAVSLIHPHPRLYWSSLEAAQTALSAAILRYAQSGGDASLKQLMKLSFPRDLLAVAERARRGMAGSEWDPAVGIAIANEMMEPLDRSIKRMGERLRVQLDESATMPRASDLVAECAMDGLVAELLCRRGMVAPELKKNAKGDDTHGKPFLHGAREVEWEPVGKADPNLWTFIKVTSPKHATAADVAKTPLMGGEVIDGSEQAHRIHASPPYFGIPIETARSVPELFQYAPLDVKARLAKGDLGPRVADGAPLAKSEFSDEVALAQAPTGRKDDPKSERSLQRADAQLAFLGERLAPWHSAAPLQPAAQFIERRKFELATDPKEAHRWQGALAAMERVLYEAAREGTEVVDELETKVRPVDAAHAQPNVRVVEAYARAAGVSHLPAEGPAALAEARKLRALLPIALAEESIRRARASLDDQQLTKHQVGAAPAPTAIDPQASALGTRAADLRLAVERGGVLDADKAEELAIDADEVGLRARIATIKTLVGHVEQRADALGMSPAIFSSGMPTVRALLKELMHKRLPRWLDSLDQAKHWRGPSANRTPDQTMLAQRRSAVSGVARSITSFNAEVELEKWLKWAHERLDDEQLKQHLSHLALEMGIMIVTGQVAGALVAGVRGLAIGADLIASAREMGLAWRATEVALHAGLATGMQGAMGGELSGKAFAENALAHVFTLAALRPFEGLLARSTEVEADIAKTWARLAKRGGKLGAEIALDIGAGIGSATLAGGLVGHDAQAGGDGSMLDHGLAIAASHFVAQRTHAMHARIQSAAKTFGAKHFEKLLARVDSLNKRAAKGAQTPRDAEEMLAERQSALVEERRLYQEHAASRDPREARAAAAGLKSVETDAHANLVDASLRLSGLEPVVDGHVYEGSHAAIERAIRAAKASNESLKHTFDEKTRTHAIVAGEKTFTLHEMGTTSSAKLDGHAVAAQVPGASYEPGGTFRIHTDAGAVELRIRRTSGRARFVRDGKDIVLEIPRGLTGKDLEHAVVEQLRSARVEVAAGKAAGPSDAPVVSDGDDKWQRALTEMLEGSVPAPGLLPDTKGNRDGLARLADIHADESIPPAVRQAFLQDFAIRLRTMDKPTENLASVLKDIVYSHDGGAKYQRKGTKIPNIEYVRDSLGGLRRLMSLRALCQRGTLSPEFYRRAMDVNDKLGNAELPAYKDLSWMNGSQKVVELIKSGAIDFNPDRDLLPTGMIKGMNRGDSGWFFAGKDADVSDVRSAQSQLAIGGAYLDGYVVVDIPFDAALPNQRTGYQGASRPTALDLTLDPLGKVNPDKSEPVGRTNPQSPDQVSAREVVLPPIPLSMTTKRTYIRAGGSHE